MPTEYDTAEIVEQTADQLITDHPEHAHLEKVEVRYLFRLGEPQVSKGNLVYGKARKITGLNAHLAGSPDGFFVVEISEPLWNELNNRQRVALVDHELHHLDVGEDKYGDPVLALRGHDLEEFVGVLARHGRWRPEITAAADALQLSMFEKPS